MVRPGVTGAILLLIVACAAQDPPDYSVMPCENDIYCYGDLLHTVQQAHLAKDSKTFVDMALKYEPETVKSNFKFMMDSTGGAPSKENIQQFVTENFKKEGSEFTQYDPPDWKANPALLKKIKDAQYLQFATELNSFWKELSREIGPDVSKRPQMYSLIPVDQPVVVPGGRFREFYYWDQFWILKGLLHCEMYQSVEGMLLNFFQMVEEIGYIPNGGRIYYRRAHPPLLIPMVYDYHQVMENTTFLTNHIATLDKEFDFWVNNRRTQVKVGDKEYDVFRYNVELINPRPEAYREDFELASKLADPAKQHELYKNLKTAAESGIDFSARWFVPDDESATGTLMDCQARHIIPVDLNVLILRNAKILQGFHEELGNDTQVEYYKGYVDALRTTIDAVFWNDTEGSWFDYNTIRGRHNPEFFPGNILPLILNDYGIEDFNKKTAQVLKHLEGAGVFEYEGGIPSSTEQTGEQWDFPNAWAPHNHWFIEALAATKDTAAMARAEESAGKWISNNFRTYRHHNDSMFEKYDVMHPGLYGGGGEYDVVIGFGWTNGVILDLLNRYGDILVSPDLNGSLHLLLSGPVLVLGIVAAVLGGRL